MFGVLALSSSVYRSPCSLVGYAESGIFQNASDALEPTLLKAGFSFKDAFVNKHLLCIARLKDTQSVIPAFIQSLLHARVALRIARA